MVQASRLRLLNKRMSVMALNRQMHSYVQWHLDPSLPSPQRPLPKGLCTGGGGGWNGFEYGGGAGGWPKGLTTGAAAPLDVPHCTPWEVESRTFNVSPNCGPQSVSAGTKLFLEGGRGAYKCRVCVWEAAVLDLGAAGVAKAAALRAADALVVLVAGVRLSQETEQSGSEQNGSRNM